MRYEHVRDKRAALLLKSHEIGILTQLKNFRMNQVSEDSILDANFDRTSIDMEACDQFRIGNSH